MGTFDTCIAMNEYLYTFIYIHIYIKHPKNVFTTRILNGINIVTVLKNVTPTL